MYIRVNVFFSLDILGFIHSAYVPLIGIDLKDSCICIYL